MSTSRTPHAFTERRFRIQLLTGEFVTCLLRGELVGDDVRHGDIVMVRGRRVRGGSYRVRWIDVLSSLAGPVIRRVTAKLSGAFRFKRVVNGLCFLLAGLVLLLSLLAGIEALQRAVHHGVGCPSDGCVRGIGGQQTGVRRVLMDFSQRRRIELPLDATNAVRRDLGGVSRPSENARKARHTGILQAIRLLDAQVDQASREEIARWIRDEYHAELGDIPIGFVAQCYLGPPYVDHQLDLFHSILEHYAPADVMPEPFSGARMLVRNGAYAFVEVYGSGDLRPVLPDGSVVL